MSYYRSPLNRSDKPLPDGWERRSHVQIEHSGHSFNSCIFDRRAQAMVWPIEEYLCRRKHTKAVVERIARLNPHGKPEGARPNGYYPKWQRRFICAAGDFVPARSGEPVAFKHGRHKFVTRVYRMQHP